MTPHNILLIRTDRIGELLLTTPAFNAVRHVFPEANITLLVKPSSYEVVEDNPSIDSILKLDTARDLDTFGKRLAFISLLRRSRFDLVVIFNPDKFFNIVAFLAGIPVRIGYNRKLGFLLTHRIEDRKHLCLKHEVDYNLELVELLGAGPAVKKLCFPVGRSEEDSVGKITSANGILAGERFVAVHPATSNPQKRWPAERFARLCELITQHFRLKVALVGGGDEMPVSEAVKAEAKVPLCDLTGKLGLKEFGSFLKRASLLISCDSGPVHIGAAVGVPVIALFGESRPGGSSRRWGPYGEGHIVIGKPRVLDITVEEVFDAVRKKL